MLSVRRRCSGRWQRRTTARLGAQRRNELVTPQLAPGPSGLPSSAHRHESVWPTPTPSPRWPSGSRHTRIP